MARMPTSTPTAYGQRNSLRPIAITMGNAAGISPEIIAKTFADTAFIQANPAFVAGDLGVMQRACAQWAPALQVRAIASPAEFKPLAGCIDVVAVSALPFDLQMGQIDARAGQAAFDAIRTAIEWANNGQISGICTAPIHKEALHAAGVPFPGHTEMLAHYSGVEDYAMILANPQLAPRVVHPSTHRR